MKLDFDHLEAQDMQRRARAFHDMLKKRRTVRDFRTDPIPEGVLEDAIRVAATAPSGANRQPWHFVVVREAGLKKRIREAAEAEERAFYDGRASEEWLDALEPIGTDAHKPFLETAPALVAIFLERYAVDADGRHIKNYYMPESVGIATGFLIAALHDAGLATLTHTPSPMGFLNELLDRPKNERPFLLLVVGLPTEDAEVPDIERKTLGEVMTVFD